MRTDQILRSTLEAAGWATDNAKSDREYRLAQIAKERGPIGVVRGIGVLAVRRADIDARQLLGGLFVGQNEFVGSGRHSVVIGREDGRVDKFTEADNPEERLLEIKHELISLEQFYPGRVPATDLTISHERLGMFKGPWVVQTQERIIGVDIFRAIEDDSMSEAGLIDLELLLTQINAAGQVLDAPDIDLVGPANLKLEEETQKVRIVDTGSHSIITDEKRYDFDTRQQAKLEFDQQLGILKQAIESPI